MQASLDEIKKYYDRGKAHFQGKRIEKAIEIFQKVIQLQPDFAEANLSLSAAYYMLGQHEPAIVHLQKYMLLHPGNAKAYISLGNVYAGIEQREEAIECYRKAIELQPNDATPYYCIGVIHCQLGDYKTAIDNFKIAIDLPPPGACDRTRGESSLASLSDIYNNMGAAYIELRRYKQAVLSCLRAIELQPEDAKIYNNLGVAYASLRQYDSAIEHFKHAIKLQPLNASAHFNLGVIFSRLDKHNEAVNHFSRVLHEHDVDDMQSSTLEVTYAQLRQPGDFIMTRERIVEVQPDEEAAAHRTLAEAYGNKNRYEAAVLGYKKAIELQPDNARAYYHLGKLYCDNQEELQGIECLSKVIEIQPDDKIYLAAFDTLLQFNNAHAVKPMIMALKSNDKYIRLSSISFLGKIGDARAVEPLIELLDDDEAICNSAVKALIKIGQKAIEKLTHALKYSENENVRWYTAYILGEIGVPEGLKVLKEIGQKGDSSKKVTKKYGLNSKKRRRGRKRSLWSRFGY